MFVRGWITQRNEDVENMKCETTLNECPAYEELTEQESVCPVDWALGFVKAAQAASCGKSTICRDGLEQFQAILSDIAKGKGRPDDTRLMEDLCQAVIADADCGLTTKAAEAILHTIRTYPDVYEEHCIRKLCKKMICSGCYSLYIDPAVCDGCGKCLQHAAGGAVSGGSGMIHVINDDSKLKNSEFLNSCPCGAIKKAGAVKPQVPEAPVPVGSFATGGLRRKRKSRL